ncbi:mitogen-activated protein kinase kinase kinase 15-like isoform X2 [Acanthaster planci]|uniref:mitogen-activated protein kinase kinase kinase n=1 Tax=Acanthaster planci TaxID=133434 RepID=A0A8B7XNR0_ACAPL|nr:mitogen-activated protein kinase kinase kinase 15-like isoform X2 [Acanthaster planci]
MLGQGKSQASAKVGFEKIRGNIALRFLSGWFREQNTENSNDDETKTDGSDGIMTGGSHRTDSQTSTSSTSTQVVCVFSCQSPKDACNKAYACLQTACKNANSTKLSRVAFEKLDFGETKVLDIFYGADVVVVDMTVMVQQRTLFYHLGVRESFGMERNIVLYFDDIDPDTSSSLGQSCHSSGYVFVPYKINNGDCYVCDMACVRPNTGAGAAPKGGADLPVQDPSLLQQLCPPLTERLQKILEEVHISNRSNAREVLLSDIRKARSKYKGAELGKELAALKSRMDEQLLLTGDIVHQFLLSYREIQDYNSMVALVEDIKELANDNVTEKAAITHLYAFALNRRKKPGDREKALKVICYALKKKENQVPDMFCLCGRIYKDRYTESNYEDNESRDQAIHWYRKGFEVQPNEYAGINLATLLVLSGKEFSKSAELQKIGMTLNNLLGKKGSLASLQDYWDVATFFEISVLAGDLGKACQAAECMFKLKPPIWYLKSTLGNIKMINKVRLAAGDGNPTRDQMLFDFWLDFFVEATKDNTTDVRFPVLVLEPTKVMNPSYITINNDEQDSEQRSLRLWHVGVAAGCKGIHEWLFKAQSIKGVSLYKRDDRCLFLYVQQNSDDFQLFFSSDQQRQHFYELAKEIIAAANDVFVGEVDSDLSSEPIQFEYEFNEKGERMLLGRGTYGAVYAARDTRTQVRMAVKEIPIRDMREVQPLHEEILLHSRLSHKNIVKYLGSQNCDGFFRIFMEQVPGGSLSALLRSKWGPLKDHEETMSFYTRQILEGLKYLHDQKIVHRDIKGDNVLVNTYSGVVKISDFGTSKRLAGINPCADSFKGTLQYMAPEVIDKGIRGHGAAADIWSLGCTVVEMATGKPPFIELGSPEAAMFKVGFYKIHPEVPASMSDLARKFILRCFEPDAEKRATAAELLIDPFLKRRRITGRNAAADYKHDRSISVPALKYRSNSRPESPVLGTHSESATTMPMDFDVKSKRRSVDMVSPGSQRNSLEVPSMSGVDGSSEESTAETPTTPDRGRGHGFYMLRKDSERRQTLLQILESEPDKIVQRWMRKLHAGTPPTKITTVHLGILMSGMAQYIKTRERKFVFDAVAELKLDLDYDHIALGEIQLALYTFLDTVVDVLKQHVNNIKPHWMFALDNLIRDSVQTAITILSPDLGHNIVPNQPPHPDQTDHAHHHHQYHHDEEGVNTSGVSTLSSSKSHDRDLFMERASASSMQVEYRKLVQEQGRLLGDLVEVQRNLNDLLGGHVRTGRDLVDHMKEDEPASVDGRNIGDDWTITEEEGDQELVEWLRSLSIDEYSISRFVREAYTLEVVQEMMTRKDLRHMGLKGGVQCRIWNAIQRHRRDPV